MHVHASALDALTIGAYLIVLMFLLRQFAARFSEKPIGKAVAAIVA
jgi:hypothetical protein